ncbi:hypothetical protein BMW23_0857 [Bodo saltans virus]|uniref:Transmembrane protein n=1 Tax=Bodo saltans virus TaxID=2024608 RepID=A0A2H4UVF6_9VIRU|nr:hypothetical protein QJ851_gp0839 [Bodo saltans virus]ATZ80902.1 hypothetical protein BMW23_0857 [Bodo saltans virus]
MTHINQVHEPASDKDKDVKILYDKEKEKHINTITIYAICVGIFIAVIAFLNLDISYFHNHEIYCNLQNTSIANTNLHNTIGVTNWMYVNGLVGIFEAANIIIIIYSLQLRLFEYEYKNTNTCVYNVGRYSLIFALLISIFNIAWLSLGIILDDECHDITPAKIKVILLVIVCVKYCGIILNVYLLFSIKRNYDRCARAVIIESNVNNTVTISIKI